MLHFQSRARSYRAISRNLGRFAAAFDLPLYQLFYRGGEAPPPTNLLTPTVSVEDLAEAGGATREEARFLIKLKGLLHRIGDTDRDVLLDLAKRLAAR